MTTDGRPEAVLLDAGGTLITLDYPGIVADLGSLGVTTSEPELVAAEAVARAWGNDQVLAGADPASLWRGYFTRLLAQAGLPEPERGPFIDKLWQRNVSEGLWRTPVPAAERVLRRLQRQGFRMAVVSNAEGRVEEDLRDAGLAPFLELVVDSHLVGVAKPDPRIFQIALEHLEVPAGRAVYVGDVYAIDVVGARAAGLVPVLLDVAGLYPGADCPRIGRLEELPGLLEDPGGLGSMRP